MIARTRVIDQPCYASIDQKAQIRLLLLNRHELQWQTSPCLPGKIHPLALQGLALDLLNSPKSLRHQRCLYACLQRRLALLLFLTAWLLLIDQCTLLHTRERDLWRSCSAPTLLSSHIVPCWDASTSTRNVVPVGAKDTAGTVLVPTVIAVFAMLYPVC